MAKFLISLTVCLMAVSLGRAEFDKEQAIQDMIAAADKCRAEVGASSADIEALMKKEPAAGKEGKCLRACLMKHFNIMDANGKFIKDNAIACAKKMADGNADLEQKGMAIIDSCAGLDVSSDACEAAEQYGKCIKDAAIAHGLPEFHM